MADIMKKMVIVALFFVAAIGFAQETIFYESTPTLEWDAVTTDSDGNPFLPADTVEYEVYLWDAANGDVTVQIPSALTLFETTAATSSLLSFPYRATWECAVRVRHTDGGSNITYSDFGYSVVAEDTATGPFVYVPTLIWLPMPPAGLRDSGM